MVDLKNYVVDNQLNEHVCVCLKLIDGTNLTSF